MEGQGNTSRRGVALLDNAYIIHIKRSISIIIYITAVVNVSKSSKSFEKFHVKVTLCVSSKRLEMSKNKYNY